MHIRVKLEKKHFITLRLSRAYKESIQLFDTSFQETVSSSLKSHIC